MNTKQHFFQFNLIFSSQYYIGIKLLKTISLIFCLIKIFEKKIKSTTLFDLFDHIRSSASCLKDKNLFISQLIILIFINFWWQMFKNSSTLWALPSIYFIPFFFSFYSFFFFVSWLSLGKLRKKPATKWFDESVAPSLSYDKRFARQQSKPTFTAVSHGFIVRESRSPPFGSQLNIFHSNNILIFFLNFALMIIGDHCKQNISSKCSQIDL